MPRIRWLVAVEVLLATANAQRTLTVNNNCKSTIWPSMLPIQTNQSFGWEADAGTTRIVDLPNAWQGYIWGRTGCDFSSDPTGKCQSGGCDGLVCQSEAVIGQGPFSRGVVFLNQSNNDLYMVQYDTGFNLPMAITSNSSCPPLGCAVDLNANCPQPLKVTSKGTTIGCMTSCEAQIDPVDQNCCQGQFADQDTCDTSKIQYYDYFHNACPQAHAYFFDYADVKLCNSAGNELQVTFCPDPSLLIAKNISTSSFPGFTGTFGGLPGSSITGNPNGGFPSGGPGSGPGSGASSSAPSLGLIVGIIVGVVAVVILAGVGLFIWRRKSRQRQRGAGPPGITTDQPGGYDPLLAAHLSSPLSSNASSSVHRGSMMYEAGGKRILQAAHPDDARSVSTSAHTPAPARGQQQPVDVQQLFENPAVASDVLRFIAQRMDAGPRNAPDTLDPPEYDDTFR